MASSTSSVSNVGEDVSRQGNYRENELGQRDGVVGSHVVSYVLRIDGDAETRNDQRRVGTSSVLQHRSDIARKREIETLESKRTMSNAEANIAILCDISLSVCIGNYLSISSDRNGSEVWK